MIMLWHRPFYFYDYDIRKVSSDNRVKKEKVVGRGKCFHNFMVLMWKYNPKLYLWLEWKCFLSIENRNFGLPCENVYLNYIFESPTNILVKFHRFLTQSKLSINGLAYHLWKFFPAFDMGYFSLSIKVCKNKEKRRSEFRHVREPKKEIQKRKAQKKVSQYLSPKAYYESGRRIESP